MSRRRTGQCLWNPWKLTAIGMALAVATALVTGVVVAHWSARALTTTPPVGRVAATPSPPHVEACNQHATAKVDKTGEVVKDALIAGAVGAGVGGATRGGRTMPATSRPTEDASGAAAMPREVGWPCSASQRTTLRR